MTNINLSQKSYVDYIASMFFNAAKVIDLSVTPKVVKVGETDVVLMHLEGVQTSTGIKVNLDLWPRDNATEADIKALPKRIDDIEFRIGFYPEIDAEGNQTLRQGTPKWTAYKVGSETFALSDGKREFGE